VDTMDLGNWNDLYNNENVESLPWYSPVLDHDIQKTLEIINPSDKILLSLGEGPGTQAIALAKMGYSVTATDISEAAIEKARKRAGQQKVDIDFIIDDIVKTNIKKTFPLIVDRGCFHVIEPRDRKKYVQNIGRLLTKGGYLFLKCFSWKQTGPGPYRFRPEEIEELFGNVFSIESVTETFYEGTLDISPMALFFIMRKK